jgi:hypothetical protein
MSSAAVTDGVSSGIREVELSIRGGRPLLARTVEASQESR